MRRLSRVFAVLLLALVALGACEDFDPPAPVPRTAPTTPTTDAATDAAGADAGSEAE